MSQESVSEMIIACVTVLDTTIQIWQMELLRNNKDILPA